MVIHPLRPGRVTEVFHGIDFHPLCLISECYAGCSLVGKPVTWCCMSIAFTVGDRTAIIFTVGACMFSIIVKSLTKAKILTMWIHFCFLS